MELFLQVNLEICKDIVIRDRLAEVVLKTHIVLNLVRNRCSKEILSVKPQKKTKLPVS